MFDTTNTQNNIFDNTDLTRSYSSFAPEDAYGLNPSQYDDVNPSINHIEGSLRADDFVIASGYELTVISGNGNVDFGAGLYDTIDISGVSVSQVTDFSLVEATEGGVAFDPGNGARMFDSMTLADGTQILFEGVDRISFADYEADLTITPDDTLYSQQWNLHMMGMQNAWRFGQGSDDVLIGVQDTGMGVDANGNFHEDLRQDETWYYNGDNLGLAGNITDDFLVEGGTSSTVQTTSHGTSVQGIIAADSNNGLGIAGINWNSDVYNIDVLDGNAGDLSIAEATQESIAFARSNGQNLVVNLSLQVTGAFGTLAPFHNDFATIVANNPDVLFVVAAGNAGNEGQVGLSSPAVLAQQYDNVMAVGAAWGTSDRLGNPTNPGQRIEYANWGSQYGNGLTVTAPSEVWTTDAYNNGTFDYSSDFNGTSAAAPNVTGVASLVWSVNPNLTAIEVQEIISETAYDTGVAGYDIYNGHGTVNADAAVRRAIALGRNDALV